jgi:hypothetical protein
MDSSTVSGHFGGARWASSRVGLPRERRRPDIKSGLLDCSNFI